MSLANAEIASRNSSSIILSEDITANADNPDCMRIFWWQHGLHLRPESQEEANMLVALVSNTRFTDKHDLAVKEISKIAVGDYEVIPKTKTRHNAKNDNRVGRAHQVLQDEAL